MCLNDLSYFVVHEIVNFLFTVPAENNLIKIRATHLLPIFYPFFVFGCSCSRYNNTPLRVASGVSMNTIKLTNQRFFYKPMKITCR